MLLRGAGRLTASHLTTGRITTSRLTTSHLTIRRLTASRLTASPRTARAPTSHPSVRRDPVLRHPVPLYAVQHRRLPRAPIAHHPIARHPTAHAPEERGPTTRHPTANRLRQTIVPTRPQELSRIRKVGLPGVNGRRDKAKAAAGLRTSTCLESVCLEFRRGIIARLNLARASIRGRSFRPPSSRGSWPRLPSGFEVRDAYIFDAGVPPCAL